MAALILPDIAYLRECFDYDPVTGVLTWRHRPRGHFISDRLWKWWNVRWAGKPAGSVMNDGYVAVKINFQSYLAHRIIWKWMTGEDPQGQVDHVRQNRIDNRWAELRAATHRQNMMNRNVSKASGLPKGVSRNRSKYVATARDAHGRFAYLGSYATPEKAQAAYVAFVCDHQGEFFYPQERS